TSLRELRASALARIQPSSSSVAVPSSWGKYCTICCERSLKVSSMAARHSKGAGTSSAMIQVVLPALDGFAVVGIVTQSLFGQRPAFVDQAQQRRVEPHGPAETLGDVDILGQQPQLEPGGVLFMQHVLLEHHLADEGLAGGDVEDVDEGFRLQAKAPGDGHRFGCSSEGRGTQVVVERLGCMPATTAANVEKTRTHGFQHRAH